MIEDDGDGMVVYLVEPPSGGTNFFRYVFTNPQTGNTTTLNAGIPKNATKGCINCINRLKIHSMQTGCHRHQLN